MKAVTWQGKRSVSVEDVKDPVIQESGDIIIKVTSSGLCGSDLHLYEVLGPFMEPGDILGHEPMGIVQEVGASVTRLRVGDRVVIPFNIACGDCFMCDRGLQSQCETTQVRAQNRGAAIFGYSKLYGQVPGAQAEFLRVPHGDYGAIKVAKGPSDDRFLYLSDVLPTAWQAVKYAHIREGGSMTIFGLGPIGDMAARIAKQQGVNRIIGIDLVPERLDRAKRHGVDVIDAREHAEEDIPGIIKEMTAGRGTDSVIDAVGLEAHGSPVSKLVQSAASTLPDGAAQKIFTTAGVDRLNALYQAIEVVRRGGTISIVGVYAGKLDPLPLDTLFDKQIQVRMGQANVRNWTGDILPYLNDDDIFGVDALATHHMPLTDAAEAYEIFQKKQDGAIKIILQP